jgi:hypothetical protein
MNSRIKIGKTISYTATDGKVFAGRGSKKKVEKHQWHLDKRRLLDEFDTLMRKLFGIKCAYNAADYPEEESEFCNNMMKEVNINADGEDFKSEISDFILDLFGFIGPERWQQIHDFLTKER